MKKTKDLKYVYCEDWFIYAIDQQKRLYYVTTEMWTEWLDVGSEEKAYEKDAVKKYMLPIAKKKWNNLRWHMEEVDGEPVKFSCFKHYWVKLNLTYYLYYRWNRQNRALRKFLKTH